MSLVEALAVMAILSVGLTAATIRLQAAATPVETGALLVEGFLRQARARAIATTSAFRVFPDAGGLATESASNCASTDWTPEPRLTLELPQGTSIAETVWTVCFTSRGVTTDTLTLTLVHPELASRRVEVFYGGSTRILP
jgi:hypothetical protein